MTQRATFLLPASVLPARLKALLEPTTEKYPHMKVEVAASFEHDTYGLNREALHMLMVAVPIAKANKVGVLRETSTGVVSGPIRLTEKKGNLRKYHPTASGYDPIVMSWGSGMHFAYSLSEKVWMSLGLSPRCFGNQNQRIVYDDPAAPDFSIAEGEISNSYYYKADRNVSWFMRNDYLRRYLWMRNCVGMRAFYYEALIDDTAEVRAVMNGQDHFRDEQDGNWYAVDIREWEGKLLLQVWATIAIILPKLCIQHDVHKLVWPDDNKPMTKQRLGEVAARIHHVYLRDSFLERYEQNGYYDTVPMRNQDGVWHCSPGYGGQWSFSGCRRIGRNIIRIEVYELYKGIPDREILHAYEHAIAAKEVGRFLPDEEHIVAKTQRLLEQLLDLGDNLSLLGDAVSTLHKDPNELVGFSRHEVTANGWHSYPQLCRLAQVAPLDMTQQAFLSRCKALHEVLQKIPNAYLKGLLGKAGCTENDMKNLGSLKLLQGLVNIVDQLNQSQDNIGAFNNAAIAVNWHAPNEHMAALFINNDLRLADAHEVPNDWLLSLERLGFDTAQINDGYGGALDFIFDAVIGSLKALNGKLHALLKR